MPSDPKLDPREWMLKALALWRHFGCKRQKISGGSPLDFEIFIEVQQTKPSLGR